MNDEEVKQWADRWIEHQRSLGNTVTPELEAQILDFFKRHVRAGNLRDIQAGNLPRTK
jgi:hypothetical protein